MLRRYFAPQSLFRLLFVIGSVCESFSQNVSCPYPEKPAHGFVNVQDDTAQYSCQVTYYLLGSSSRTCSSKFAWSESAPLCAADVAAGMPAFISSGVNGSDAFFATDILPANQLVQPTAPVQNDGSCAQTEWEPAPWLIVDLLSPSVIDGYNISKLGYIDVQHRHNESQSLEILVGNSTSDMTLNSVCAQYDNIPAESGLYLSGYCVSRANGRYIVVRAISNNPANNIKLGLCKVVILSASVLTSAHCPSPAYHRIFRSKCYDIRSSEEMPWSQADQYCKEHNGRLTVVESQVDHDFLAWEISRTSLRRAGTLSQVNSYWLGLRKLEKDKWLTSNGKSVVFEAWAGNASTKPFGDTNLCASVDSQRPSQWLKTNCDNFAGWICEYSVAFCGVPATPEGVVGYIPSKRFYSLWENVTFSCGARQYLYDIKITCLPGGTWSEPETTCDMLLDTKYACPPLVSISNGILVMLANNLTFVMYEYRCNEGFRLVGNESLICLDSGEWSNEIPSCVAQSLREPTVLCPKPHTIDNGNFLLSQEPPKSGAHVLYSCNVGFVLQGASILTCIPSGTWSSSYPQCLKESNQKCVELTIINADVVYLDQGKSPGQRAMVQCRKGYILRGEPLLWCTSFGSWNVTPPYCDVLTPFILNGAPKENVIDTTTADNSKNGNIPESTWAILVTGLVGAALFVAVIGFGAAFVISKWRRHEPKPENQIITYQIGQQLPGDQYPAQLMGSSPTNSPHMPPILYTINSSGNIPAQANFHFAAGYASYQLEPAGSFAYHSSMVRPTKISVQRRKSVGSSSELSGMSSRIESRRSSEPAPSISHPSVIVSEQLQSTSGNTMQVTAAVEQSSDNDNLNNDEIISYEAFSNNSEIYKDTKDETLWKESTEHDPEEEICNTDTSMYQPMTVETVFPKSASQTVVTEHPPSASPSVSPLVIRSGYSSPREKINTPTFFKSASSSPDETPKFSVHISATATTDMLNNKNSSGKSTRSGTENAGFVLEEIVVSDLQIPGSRRNSSSSSYLGGSSSDGSNQDNLHCRNVRCTSSNVDTAAPVTDPKPADKPEVPVKTKTLWSVRDLQTEIRSLPLFQRLRKSLGEDEQNTIAEYNASLDRNCHTVERNPKPPSPPRNPKQSLPPAPPVKQRPEQRKELSDIGTSTPLAFLDNQFADDGQFFEETSSDEVMYEQVAQMESPETEYRDKGSEGRFNKHNASCVNVEITGTPPDSSENSSLDSCIDVATGGPQYSSNQEQFSNQYYGPTARLSDSSLNTSDDQMPAPRDNSNNKQYLEESSSAEQHFPPPYHARLRRIYTQPNQRNFDNEREIQSESERYRNKQMYHPGQIYPKRSPPIMGTKGLRRIPTTGIENASGTRSEGEIENKPRMYYTERFPPIATVAPTHRAPPPPRLSSQRRGQSPRKYPNSPRLGRNSKLQMRTSNELRAQRSLSDSEDEVNTKVKPVTASARGSMVGNKRHMVTADLNDPSADKERKRGKSRVLDNFEAYLPNDEALLSEKFELDQNFLEPVELRHSGYHRSQSGYPVHLPRTRSAQSQRASMMDVKLVSGNKPKPNPRQSHSLQQSAPSSNLQVQNKEIDYKRKSNLVSSSTSKHVKLPPAEVQNSAPSVSWDAKKFKHRHKRVQFKDDIDEIISHSPEPTSDDDAASHVQSPAYQYWRQNLRPTQNNNPGQRYGVNILSD